MEGFFSTPPDDFRDNTTYRFAAMGDALEREALLLLLATTAARPDITVIQSHAQTLWQLLQTGQAARVQSIAADNHSELYDQNPKHSPY